MTVSTVVFPEPLPEGAAEVETLQFQLVQHHCAEILTNHGMLKVHGKPGMGKTRSVDHFSSTTKAQVVKIHLAAKVRGNAILRDLCEGLGEPTSGDATVLLDRATKSLWERCVLIYVDEADQANKDGLRHIRYIYDRRDTTNLEKGLPERKMRFAVVLVGMNFKPIERLAPELFSRVTRQVDFKPLEGAAMIAALQGYHHFFAGAEIELLTEINRDHVHGEWRGWRIFLEAGLAYGPAMGTDVLTRELAKVILGSMGPRLH